MVHVSPHGMSPSSGKGGGDASLKEVLLWILLLGGGFIGVSLLVSYCEDQRAVHRTAPVHDAR